MFVWIYKVFVKIFGDCNGKADKVLHSLLSYLIYLALFGVFVWSGIDWQASLMGSACITYFIGYFKEKNDQVFDEADIRANVTGIMAGMCIAFIIGVVTW